MGMLIIFLLYRYLALGQLSPSHSTKKLIALLYRCQLERGQKSNAFPGKAGEEPSSSLPHSSQVTARVGAGSQTRHREAPTQGVGAGQKHSPHLAPGLDTVPLNLNSHPQNGEPMSEAWGGNMQAISVTIR